MEEQMRLKALRQQRRISTSETQKQEQEVTLDRIYYIPGKTLYRLREEAAFQKLDYALSQLDRAVSEPTTQTQTVTYAPGTWIYRQREDIYFKQFEQPVEVTRIRVRTPHELAEIKATAGVEVEEIPWYEWHKETKETVPFKGKGIAETLWSFETKPLLSYFGIRLPAKTPMEMVKPKETVRPIAGFAGVIAPFEAAAYIVPRLLRIETPRPPPTFISLQPSRAVEYGPEYAAGTITGDIMLSIVIGKAVGKIWARTPKIVKAPIQKVSGVIEKPFRPIVSRLEKIALWPHEKIAPGIIDIPEFAEPLPKALIYQEMAWEPAETPKTSALLITKYTGPTGKMTSSWVMEHWLKKTMGGMSYALVKTELETVKPISEVSRRGLPYVPSVETVKTSALFPLFKLPVFEEPYEIQKLKLFPQMYPVARQRERLIPIIKPVVGPLSVQKIKQIPMQIQLTRQLQKQVQFERPPTPPKIPQPPIVPKLPFLGFDLGAEPSQKQFNALFGKWFFRKYPIVKPRQVMRNIVGFPTRRRKK